MEPREYIPSTRIINLIGRRYGRLVVTEYVDTTKRRKCRWLCKCDCAAIKIVQGSNLNSGHTQTCGCSWREAKIKRNTTHGQSHTPTYRTWAGVIKRCSNPRDKSWSNYGGRGIKVCERWNKFENFLADMGERPAGHSIDRIDADGHYESSNCKWSTAKEQSRNRRDRKRYIYNGESLLLAEWSERTGISISSLWSRLKYMTLAEALTLPRYTRRWKNRPIEAQ